jgi:integrase
MAIHKLTPRKVENAKKDGLYGDGGGLALQVRNDGRAKSWIFRYRGKWMGLGSLDTFSLAEARERARICRQQLADGLDPLQARKDQRVAAQLEASKSKTVQECAREWMDAHTAGWTAFTAREIERRISKYVIPKIGSLPVHLVDEGHVHEALNPIWGKGKKTPTADLTRQHLEAIIDWATAKKYRRGDNPASWSGPISTLLPAAKKIHKPTHHPSLPYQEVGRFIADLRALRENRSGQGADPLTPYLIEFVILTAVRKQQALFATWPEIDLAARMWTCPAAKTKTGHMTGEAHKVFLSPQAIRILEKMRELQEEDGTNGDGTGYVFVHRTTRRPGQGRIMTGKPFSIHTMKAFLHRAMKRTELTMHGFRTTFKSWAVDTNQDEIAGEMALDHRIGNSVRNIYARDAGKLEQRRLLMDAWGAYCDRTEPLPADVIPFRQAK